MATVSQKVLNWLYSVLTSEYSDINRTYSDVAQTLSNYPSLLPRTDVYSDSTVTCFCAIHLTIDFPIAYEHGAPALLLLLSGTIPVTFRGTVYKFPIAIWIPHAYPREPPMVFVTPTTGMAVRPGQHVSIEGRIYHPYLAQWAELWDRSNLRDFLAVLREVFTREPPVVSKRHINESQHPANQSVSIAAPPLPPLPPGIGTPPSRSSHKGSTFSSSPVPPPPPPKPFDSPSGSFATSITPIPPPVPPLPNGPSNDHRPEQESYVKVNAHTTNPAMHHIPRRSSSLRHGSDPTTVQAPERSDIWTRSPVGPVSPVNQHQRQYDAPQPYRLQYGLRNPPTPGTAVNRGYQQAHSFALPQTQQQLTMPRNSPKPAEDLLSSPLSIPMASQDKDGSLPAPPIPPNPEKDALLAALSSTLRQHISQSIGQAQSVIPSLEIQEDALRQASQNMQAEMSALQSLDSMLLHNEKILHGSMHEADHVISSAGTRSAPGVDEVLVAPTIVGGQLYELCAEEGALADAMFVLGRGLDRGRVPCETFVKQTRSLAREQFLKKALIKKISQGMGLVETTQR
ncbi:MAG: hypothetical protein M1819_002591 [Sarea resinae]|nr:MAG: hypothetical protein M1819_002591 [Sarea resinae]